MSTIKISYDEQNFRSKPSGKEIRQINNRIAASVRELDQNELKETIKRIGSKGCTFSPATFKNGVRNKDNFEQQQLFALDFDNKDPKKKITFDDVKERAAFMNCRSCLLTTRCRVRGMINSGLCF